MTDKTMRTIQTEVDDHISQFKTGYFSPLAMMARITEETGELAREINHYYGEKQKKTTEAEVTVQAELGDLLFTVICMANALEIDLQDAHDHVMHKFKTRDKDRWERKDEAK